MGGGRGRGGHRRSASCVAGLRPHLLDSGFRLDSAVVPETCYVAVFFVGCFARCPRAPLRGCNHEAEAVESRLLGQRQARLRERRAWFDVLRAWSQGLSLYQGTIRNTSPVVKASLIIHVSARVASDLAVRIKGAPKMFFGQMICWRPGAPRPNNHIVRKIVVFWPCRRRR